jgi:hypothetical protein
MVSVGSLWLPILLSAVFVFVVSAIFHMVLKYHQSDFKGLPGEAAVLDALRKPETPPGEYMAPHCASANAMKDPEFVAKMERGPIVLMTVAKGTKPSMGKSLALWFVYCLIVSVIAAYLTSHAVPAGGPYRSVMRFAGCAAFLGYGMAVMQASIWYNRPWGTTFKNMFDGLVYGLVTGGTFGWLWPR